MIKTAEIKYRISMKETDKNGYHIYAPTILHTICMCPNKIWKVHSNFEEFVEYLIHWQLCERICLESRIHKVKSKYKCNTDSYCPMEIPALLMLGEYKNGYYHIFRNIE